MSGQASRRAIAVFIGPALWLALTICGPVRPLQAQLPELTGPQKSVLLMIAREVIEAALAGRPSREATVEPRLMQPQAMVASIYVDGQLRARAWRLRRAGPAYLEARDLVYEALAKPKIRPEPLAPEELARASISLAVLSEYTPARDDAEVPPNSAVIIYHGFTEWLALPGDVDSDDPAELLSYACEQAGLRPLVWLLPQTTIFAAKAEIMREERF